MKHLKLDTIWWVVSPQNPLKESKEMAPFTERLNHAKKIAQDPRILVTDIEDRISTRFTIDSIKIIQRSFLEKKFIWIMGADNLIQIPQWKNWRELFSTVPIVIFDRAPYSVKALSGKAAQVFSKSRLPPKYVRELSNFKPPAWTFIRMPLHPATATEIRRSSTSSIKVEKV